MTYDAGVVQPDAACMAFAYYPTADVAWVAASYEFFMRKLLDYRKVEAVGGTKV